jgi:glycosyltransferase involved in cell wall biosynthesis
MINQNQPLISIIVPIYGIDRYLGLCIESIINQTYKNLEIILVDDGGSDRCPEICDLYASKDKRIKVIHKLNGGLVSARKAGLQESNGTYISYVDGDDWIGAGFIESLYSSAILSNADVVCAGFTKDLFSKSSTFTNAISSGVYDGEKLEELKKHMISFGQYYCPGITTYVWNKLFKREALFDSQMNMDNRITIGEDAAVTYPVLFKSKKITVIDNVAYHYRQREDSMLKQSASYSREAQKLKYLYDYLCTWADGTKLNYNLRSQVDDYILANAIMRSGGNLPNDDFSTFDKDYFNKKVVIFSAGTFGQQLVNRFENAGHCKVVGWIDVDYWEYRRCCLNVDPIQTITSLDYDYILVAKVDGAVVSTIKRQLMDLGVEEKRILTINVPDEKTSLIKRFLDVEAIRAEEEKKEREVLSHA